MAVDNARSLALLRKLDRLLAGTQPKPLAPQRAKKHGAMRTQFLPPERVHQIRTTARRLEAVLEALADRSGRKQNKLRKRLKRLRRSAGGVRDIDVQIAALRRLKIGREQERKARLMQALAERRSEREQKFLTALHRKAAQKLRKGLRRWMAEISGGFAPETEAAMTAGKRGAEFDGVAASLRKFYTLSRHAHSLTPENLHAYRTRCKRIRYVAEMSGDMPEGKRIVEQLKRVQDAVGDWHDWLTLTAFAESLFSHSPGGALVAALHNVTNAKFVEARGVCLETRRAVLAQYREMPAERRGQRLPTPGTSKAPGRRRRVEQEPMTEIVTAPVPKPARKTAVSVGIAPASVA